MGFVGVVAFGLAGDLLVTLLGHEEMRSNGSSCDKIKARIPPGVGHSDSDPDGGSGPY